MSAAVTPDEWNDRRLDDLAAQVRVVASLATQVATHTAKIDGADDDIKALREMLRDFVTESRKVLVAFNATCETRVQRVEMKVDELTRAQRWTPAQWAAIVGPALTALIGAAALVIVGGPS